METFPRRSFVEIEHKDPLVFVGPPWLCWQNVHVQLFKVNNPMPFGQAVLQAFYTKVPTSPRQKWVRRDLSTLKPAFMAVCTKVYQIYETEGRQATPVDFTLFEHQVIAGLAEGANDHVCYSVTLSGDRKRSWSLYFPDETSARGFIDNLILSQPFDFGTLLEEHIWNEGC